MIPLLAFVLLVPVAGVTWRHSKPVSIAVGALFASTCTYLVLARLYPEAHAAGAFEAQRWGSLIAGCVGIAELGRRAAVRRAPIAERVFSVPLPGRPGLYARARRERSITCAFTEVQETARVGRPDALAFALVLSAVADGLAMLWWRGTSQWGPQPFFQIVVSLAMIAVSVWPRRNHA